MTNILSKHLKNKAGFYEAVARLSENDEAVTFGDLENLIVHGDTGTGRVKSPCKRPETRHQLPTNLKKRFVSAGSTAAGCLIHHELPGPYACDV